MTILADLTDLPIEASEQSFDETIDALFDDPSSEGPEPPINIEIPTQEIDDRLARWKPCFDIKTEHEQFQLRQLVTESLRIEKCQNEEWARQHRSVARAKNCWALDRNSEVYAIVAKLPRNPERWRNELVRTASGCQWMIDQWRGLKAVLIRTGTWDDRQRSRALDLLGVPTLYREERTPIDLPPGAGPEYLITRTKAEIEHLNKLREQSLLYLDQQEREIAEQGLRLNFDRESQAIRRFEAGCQRRYHQLLKELQKREIANRPKKPHTPTPKREPSNDMLTKSIMSALKLKPTPANETEHCSPRLDPEHSRPTTRPASPNSAPIQPPTSPPLEGNRRQRRKAAALARKGR